MRGWEVVRLGVVMHERMIVFLLRVSSSAFIGWLRRGRCTISNSSRSATVSLLVLHAGAVQPRGFFPTMLVRTSMLFFSTSRCCSSLRVETNSCV
jgi:hypothetical protein